MKLMSRYLLYIALVATIAACGPAGGEDRGHEFMPDMAHSIAYESNIYNYYGLNTYSEESDYKTYAMPRKPVEGTVPRGSAGLALRSPEEKERLMMSMNGQTQINEISIPSNGSVSYGYDNTDDERVRAAREITQNPLPITASGLSQGKELYEVFCGICHGSKGAGDGYLAREGGPYAAVPANLIAPKFRDTTDGLYYHAIMHGKNVMGAYADKLSYEERWNVIHYIRSLQAKDQSLAYSEEENTLNNAITGASYYAGFTMPESSTKGIYKLSGGHADHGAGHGDGHGEDHGHKADGDRLHDGTHGHDVDEDDHSHEADHDDHGHEHQEGHDEKDGHDHDENHNHEH